jgi:hypothetical protein
MWSYGANPMATERQAKRALELFERQLSKRKHVVGLGIVPASEEGGSHKDEMAVAVYVKKKLPAKNLAARDLVPESLEVPGRKAVIRVPTRVIEQGVVRLEHAEPDVL